MKRTAFSLSASLLVAALIGIRPVSAQTPRCTLPLTPGCLYFPAIEYGIGTEPPEVTRETAYKDISGAVRTVKMAIRVPVVIWSHGGAEGKRQPDGVEWLRSNNIETASGGVAEWLRKE